MPHRGQHAGRPQLTKWPVTPDPLPWAKYPADPKRAAMRVLRLFSDFRDARYNSRLWWAGDPAKQRWWPQVLKATALMREQDVPPAAWTDG